MFLIRTFQFESNGISRIEIFNLQNSISICKSWECHLKGDPGGSRNDPESASPTGPPPDRPGCQNVVYFHSECPSAGAEGCRLGPRNDPVVTKSRSWSNVFRGDFSRSSAETAAGFVSTSAATNLAVLELSACFP